MGGNSLGLYGGVFGPAGDIILAHGYQGAFHIWKRRDDGSLLWKPVVAPSGHFGPVHVRGVDTSISQFTCSCNCCSLF